MNQTDRTAALLRWAPSLAASLFLGTAGSALGQVEGLLGSTRSSVFTREDVLESLLNVGPFEIRPHVLGTAVYDDNIRISSTDQQSDVIMTLAPGVLVGAGNYRTGGGTFVSLDYTPAFLLYTDHNENSTVDHALTLAGQYTFTKLTVGLTHSFQASSGGLVEVGDRVDRRIHATTLTSRYQYSTKTSFEVNLRQTIAEYDGLAVSGYNEWINQDWFNYALTEKVTLGVGTTFGVRDVQGSPNEAFEQGLVRAGYHVTEKIDATTSLGGEFRQFQGGRSSGPTFVFSLGAIYRPRVNTEVSLEGFRQDQSAVIAQSQNYITTGLRASVQQRIRDRWTVGVSGGYQHASFRSTEETGPTARDDDYWYAGPEVSYKFSDRWNIGVFYLYRENSSTEAAFEFGNNQFGLRSSFRF